MKTRILSNWALLALLTFTLLAPSCKKDDDGGGGGSAAEGTITAKVDGTRMTTLSITTFATHTGNIMQIQGNTGGTSAKAIEITLLGSISEGTYELGGGYLGANTAAYVETEINLANPANPEIKTWTAPYNSSIAGEVKISQITDTHVIGTFSFKAGDQDGNVKNITDGSFNIKKNSYF